MTATKTSILALALSVAAALGTAAPAHSQSDYELLEQYSFALGESSGFELSMHDRNLGTGTAQLRLELSPLAADSFSLDLEIFRYVPPDMLMFALLLDRIEIELLGPHDVLLRRVVLDAELGPNGLLTIGDSKGGHFEARKRLERLDGLRGLRVRLFGNYE